MVSAGEYAWLAAAAAVVVLSLDKLTSFPVWDTALWEYAGRAIARGATLYGDVWDNKLPSIYYLNALFALLLPGRFFAHQSICAAIDLGSVLLFAAFLRGEGVRGWASAAFAFAVVLSLCAAQLDMPEYDALALMLGALVAWQHERRVTAGVLLALASSFWMQSALLLVPLLVCTPSARARRTVAAAFAGTAAALLALFLAVFGHGALGELVGAWWSYLVAGGGSAQGQVHNGWRDIAHDAITGLVASGAGPLLAAALAVLARPRDARERFVLLWAAAMLVAVLPLTSYYDHYFVPLLAPLIALVWIGVPRVRASLAARAPALALRGVAAAIGLLLLVKTLHYALPHQRSYANEATASRRVGAAIRSRLGPHAVVAFDGYEPGIALAADTDLPDRFALAAAPNRRWLATQHPHGRVAHVRVVTDFPAHAPPGFVAVCPRTAAPFALYADSTLAQRFSGCT